MDTSSPSSGGAPSREGLGPAAATLFAAASAVLLVVAAPASASTDTAAGASFHPFTMPLSSGCVALVDDHGTSHNCDPVNLIFPGRTWRQVRQMLLARRWTTRDLGSTERLHFGTSTLYGQDAQVFRGDGRNKRYHVRLWQVRGVTFPITVGAVHHEVGLLEHRIDMSWDGAEGFVARQLCRSRSTCSRSLLASQHALQGSDSEWRGRASDAQATIVR